jgi:hypothetical protein
LLGLRTMPRPENLDAPMAEFSEPSDKDRNREFAFRHVTNMVDSELSALDAATRQFEGRDPSKRIMPNEIRSVRDLSMFRLKRDLEADKRGLESRDPAVARRLLEGVRDDTATELSRLKSESDRQVRYGGLERQVDKDLKAAQAQMELVQTELDALS